MSPSASGTDDDLRLAVLRHPHGLKGEISAELLGQEFAEALAPGTGLRWEKGGRRGELVVESCRPAGARYLVKIAGCDDRESAADLCGGFLCIGREELGRPSADFLFEDEIRGFRCVSVRGEPLGEARAFERHAGHVYLEVARGQRTVLVPYTRPIVAEVDRAGRRLVLDPPEGLFEI